MVTDRLEVRLDTARRRKLTEVAAARGMPVSATVSAMIDEADEAVTRADRLRAVAELARLDVEDMPDPETLSRQLAETYAVDLP